MALPSSTLIISSRLFGEKNQKTPVSEATGIAVPLPLVPWGGTAQLTWTLKRPFWSRSVVEEPSPVTRPTLGAPDSVYQTELSPGGPATIRVGALLAKGREMYW